MCHVRVTIALELRSATYVYCVVFMLMAVVRVHAAFSVHIATWLHGIVE